MNTLAQKHFSFLVGAILAVASLPALHASPDTGVDFFEKKIRPILIENCYKCHSAESEKSKGGLRLDTKDNFLKGGDSGPALVPGAPDKSLFIKAVHYTDENLQMPPKGKKLSAEQIADLENWVKIGAPDPRIQTTSSKAQNTMEAGKKHWAFQPIKDAPIPAVKNKKWIKTPVDNFILAKLEEKKLKPSTQADKRTLIRRATFDLTGLPPTEQEVENFEDDGSSTAFAKVVDRLLASPRYGERWGRHWLDVARYADTKGYVFMEERRYPFAYTYRDYVIRALNEDLPYNQFIMQQLAADQLPLGDDKRPLAAMGFLTVGRRFLNNQNDIIDDRIDVTARGLMGLTVACARCHDHKFDPIPTKDYYSLYGIFDSSVEPAEKPLLGIIPPKHPEYLVEKKKKEDAVTDYTEKKQDGILEQIRERSGEYILAAFDLQRLEKTPNSDGFIAERKLDGGVTRRWMASLEGWKKQHSPVFAPWFAFAEIPTNQFAIKSKELSAQFLKNEDKAKPINPVLAKVFTNAPASLKEVADLYGKVFKETDDRWSELEKASAKSAKGKTNSVPPTALPEASWEELRQVLFAADAPPNLPRTELRRFYSIEIDQKIKALNREIDELDAVHPGAPPRAMVMNDGTPHNVGIFIRGNAANRGAEAPREFLQILSGENRKPFEKGSGRLELAQAIASTNNPLTARVIVNRVWLYHFGKPLVSTPSDFGVRSDPPTHPELLDWLSYNFVQNGWSLKKLHRQMMLSSAYQQRSDDIPESLAADPSNLLLWKMNRQRLDFEALRDSLLAVSGKIDLTTGGQPVDIVADDASPRRSIYGFIDRQNLPGLFRTFDFANPDASSSQRFYTTVPQQALFLLNSPFVVEQARNLLTNANIEKISRNDDKVKELYERAFQRRPDKSELKFAQQYLKAHIELASPPVNSSAWKYGFGTIDKASRRVTFYPLPFFEGKRWQNSANFPDSELGYAMLDIDGGHPGNRAAHSVIRRWTSPFDGVVKIEGTLGHIFDKGDGVHARIISSSNGEMGKWVAFNKHVETIVQKCRVKKGDTIDFMTDLKTTAIHDTFKWSVVIKVTEVKYGTPPPVKTDWNSIRDFDGPQKDHRPLNAWEKFAQALLVSNEFIFVD